MQIATALSLWSAEVMLIAALAARPWGARIAALVALGMLVAPAWVDSPPIATALVALAFLWVAVRATDFVFEPAPVGFAARLVHLVALLDTRKLRPGAPRFHRDAWRRLLITTTLAGAGLLAVLSQPDPGAWTYYPVRWTGGVVLAMASLETMAAALEALTAALGWSTPLLHDSPHLARTIAEFWGRRWNRIVSGVLRDRAFVPLARLNPLLAVTAAFALSAAFHAYLIGFASGTAAALAWSAFFMIQPLAIAAERRLGVRRWASWAGRTWTLTVVGLASPLMVEPGLRALGI